MALEIPDNVRKQMAQSECVSLNSMGEALFKHEDKIVLIWSGREPKPDRLLSLELEGDGEWISRDQFYVSKNGSADIININRKSGDLTNLDCAAFDGLQNTTGLFVRQGGKIGLWTGREWRNFDAAPGRATNYYFQQDGAVRSWSMGSSDDLGCHELRDRSWTSSKPVRAPDWSMLRLTQLGLCYGRDDIVGVIPFDSKWRLPEVSRPYMPGFTRRRWLDVPLSHVSVHENGVSWVDSEGVIRTEMDRPAPMVGMNF